jgi:predicted ester cyclase
MTSEDSLSVLNRFVDAINRGDLDAMEALSTHDYFDYTPRPDQDPAHTSYRLVIGSLLSAFPDFKVTVSDMQGEGDRLTGQVSFGGTQDGNLWGLPPTGLTNHADAAFDARIEDGKLAFRLREFNMLETLRAACVVPQPEDMWRKPEHQIHIPLVLLVLAFNGGTLKEKPCSHIDLIQVKEPATKVCQQCVELDTEWPSLRMCLVCGFVGCCDTSVHRHTLEHYQETGHPIYRSIDPGDSWVWCYEDKAVLTGLVDPMP